MAKVTNAISLILISFIISVIIGYFLIKILTKKHINQSLSIYLEERHKSKSHTPTMGGLIFSFTLLIIGILLYITNKITISFNLIIVLFTIFSYSLIGFIDDFLIIKKHNNKGLSEKAKFLLQMLVALIFFYLFLKAGNETLIWIHSLNIKINISWFYGLFILFVLVASSNAVNLTDGLDGLAGGLSLIAFLTFGIITYNTSWLSGYIEIAYTCFIIVGSLFGFLIYNMNPARIFMGDTGSLALGAGLGSIAILTRHELLLVLIGIVFVIETLTCIIQRFYFKLTHKRLFLMTPIHHSFEKKGYRETDIVKYFWITGILASLVALAFGVLL